MFQCESVAIIVPERLGDTLFHTPSIRFLRKMRPDIRIEIVALSALAASIFVNNPYIDAIHTTPDRYELKRIATRCQVVLNIHDHATSRQCAEAMGTPCITAAPAQEVLHTAAHSQVFFEQLLGAEMQPAEKRYALFPGDGEYACAERLLRAGGADPGRDILIGCHIGCHSIAKKGWQFWRTPTHPKIWPLRNFTVLADMLHGADPRFRLVLTGSVGEARMGRQLEQATPSVINLIGKTSVLELAALMGSLHLYVTPDTGALHVACAADIGLVALFGPTSPAISGPYPKQPHHSVVQASRMEDIAPATVCAAILGHPSLKGP